MSMISCTTEYPDCNPDSKYIFLSPVICFKLFYSEKQIIAQNMNSFPAAQCVAGSMT